MDLIPKTKRREFDPFLPTITAVRRTSTGEVTRTVTQPSVGSVTGSETLRSADNPIWFYKNKWTKSGDPAKRALWEHFKKTFLDRVNIDGGNGAFTLDRIQRIPLYRDMSIPWNRRTSIQDQMMESGPFRMNASTSYMEAIAKQNLYFPAPELQQELLYGKGAQAINNTIPYKEVVNLGVSLGELLREGLPSLVGLALIKNGGIRGGSGEFLNYQFGIAPLISDLQSLCLSVKEANRLLESFNSRHGKHFRRRYTFPIDKTTEDISNVPGSQIIGTVPASSYHSGPTSVRANVIRRASTTTWFSGAFVYATPTTDDGIYSQWQEFEANANHLLGTRITPETIWNLTAWTWLIDWFLSLGDVVSNISRIGRDGLVLQYGYIMQRIRAETTFTLPGTVPIGKSAAVSETLLLERKMRRKALPYGFGPTYDSMSETQWAILGALGMSKAPRSLW